MAGNKKTTVRKRKVRKNIARGVAHIHSTFNNTIVTICDEGGNAVAIAKGNEDLVNVVNKVISRVVEDGTMNKYIEEATILSSEEVEE